METGGSRLDEEAEISAAVSSMLRELDDNQDSVVRLEDLTKYWANMGEWSIFSVRYTSLMPSISDFAIDR